MQLFVNQGFGSTNVQDIADTAGISIGLLYRHYKNKDQLFNEVGCLRGWRIETQYYIL